MADDKRPSGSTTRDELESEVSSKLSAFADLHRRTHEIELLVSAAVVFALVRLPALLETLGEGLLQHLSQDLVVVPRALVLFATSITWALVLTFLVHLVARAFWIGLLGLESVFPDGIHWQAIETHGPFQRRFNQRFLPTLPRLIEFFDQLCSVLFSLAFLLVIMIAIGFLGAVIGGLSIVLFRSHYGPEAFGTAALIFAVIAVVPSILLLLLDKVLVVRYPSLVENERLRKVVDGTLTAYGHLFLSRLWAPMMLTLQSRVRRKSGWPFTIALIVTMMSLMLVPTVTMLVRQGALRMDGYQFFPKRAGAGHVDTIYYEDRWDPESPPSGMPSIPSDVVEGPYLRIFLPYSPVDDQYDLEELCPNVDPLQPDGLRLVKRSTPTPPPHRARAALRCLAGLWEVRLDSRIVTSEFRFAHRRETEQRGLVAYIPTAALAEGAHQLLITRRKVRDGEHERQHPILFWI